MTTGLVVRPAVATDALDLGRLIASVYLEEGWSPESARPRLGDGAWVMAQGHALVAVAEGGLVGAVLLVLPGQPGRQVAHADEAEVRLLAVSPAARGLGAGEALMRHLLEAAEAAGFSRIVLSTQPGMLAAQRLYERLGFERRAARDWDRPSGSARMLVYARALASV
ncbi:MAG: GNAT family N-acetyltransferase [Dehalococcoidia bacterium]